MAFGALIIGDEIVSGKRVDQHFNKIIAILGARGLRLAWAQYLGDDRERIAATLERTFASGDVVVSFGGIGNTPDDHTRQAAAQALGQDLVLHPDAEREIRARFGAETNERRLLLGTFPRGVAIVPNPFNRIPGFCTRDHYFLPGFPQMAHPMAEWALDTFHSHLFNRSPSVDASILRCWSFRAPLLNRMSRWWASASSASTAPSSTSTGCCVIVLARSTSRMSSTAGIAPPEAVMAASIIEIVAPLMP